MTKKHPGEEESSLSHPSIAGINIPTSVVAKVAKHREPRTRKAMMWLNRYAKLRELRSVPSGRRYAACGYERMGGFPRDARALAVAQENREAGRRASVRMMPTLKLLGAQAGESGFSAPIWLNVEQNRVFFVADMDEDNDGPNGNPTRDPYWQPETTLQFRGKSIDSMKVAGVVVPTWLPKVVGPIVLGCQARVTNLAIGIVEPAVTYDLGPTNKAGEGSNLLCKRIGAQGGENRALFLYEIFLGVPAVVDGVTYDLQPLRRA